MKKEVLKRLSDAALERLETNLKTAPSKFSGNFSLVDVGEEKKLRLGAHAGIYDRWQEEMKRAPDGLITYPEAYLTIHPDDEWHFRRSIKKTRKMMDDVLRYCQAYDKPPLTVRIVQTGSRKPNKKAKANIFERCRELGYRTSATNADDFFEEQLAATAKLLH